MTKDTPVDYPILDIFKNRWSPRSFSDKKITQDDMNKIFEAARWSASSGNEQPWNYAYAFHGDEGFGKLFNCLDDGNQKWAGTAMVLIAAVMKKINSEGEVNELAQHDTGLANAHLLLQATALDIFAHPMAGFEIGKVIELLKLDKEHEPVCMIALGYLGDAEKLQEPYRSREKLPRRRKKTGEFTTLL